MLQIPSERDDTMSGVRIQCDLLGSRPFLAGTINEELGVFVCYGESLYSIIDDMLVTT